MALFEDLLVANRVKSVILIVLFVLFYTAMIFGVVVAAVALAMGVEHVRPPVTLALIAVASHGAAVLLAVVAYTSGPALVLNTSRAEFIDKDRDPVLHHLVEEMSLAAGVPAPKIYVIDTPSLNAFAVGYHNRGAVVITQGLRERLTRDQLQGVVAHEVARMENQDLHLMTLVAGLVGLTVLVGRLYWGAVTAATEGARPEDNLLPLIVISVFSPVIVPVLVISPILGRIIQLAVSRERQYLADAEAARLTRYPEALAQALEIMAADGSDFDGATLATVHLFIVPPMTGRGRRTGGPGQWSSHPTIDDRVARLRSIGSSQ